MVGDPRKQASRYSGVRSLPFHKIYPLFHLRMPCLPGFFELSTVGNLQVQCSQRLNSAPEVPRELPVRLFRRVS